MEQVKFEHYVPQLYLRRFTYDGSHLFAYDAFKGRSYKTFVRVAAGECYFYDAPLDLNTSQSGDRDPLQMTEHHLKEIEDAAAPALQTLIDGVENHGVIYPATRPDTARFLAVQFFRTPETRLAIAQIRDRLIEALEDERLSLGLEKRLAEMNRPGGAAVVQSRILRSGSSVEEITGILLRHIWFIGINGTSAPLWTSDHPVVRRSHVHHPILSHAGLASPGIEIGFPLSPKMVLTLAERTVHKNLESFDGESIKLRSEVVTTLNRQQAAQCYQHVYAPTNDFALIHQMRQNTPDHFRPNRRRIEVR